MLSLLIKDDLNHSCGKVKDSVRVYLGDMTQTFSHLQQKHDGNYLKNYLQCYFFTWIIKS